MRAFEFRIRAAEAGSNSEVNNFDNPSFQIEDDVSRVDVFMNDVSGMDFA